MTFVRSIEVVDYDSVTVTSGDPFTVSLNIEDGEDRVTLELFASESKFLREALEAAELLLAPPGWKEHLVWP